MKPTVSLCIKAQGKICTSGRKRGISYGMQYSQSEQKFVRFRKV